MREEVLSKFVNLHYRYTIGCLGFLVADAMEYFTFTDSKILKTNVLCSLIGVYVCGVCVGVCGCARVRVWTIVCSVIGVQVCGVCVGV